MSDDAFSADISRHIWDTKYRLREGGRIVDERMEDTWRRVAQSLAAVEKADDRNAWAERFYRALEGFRFLPGGRILAGAGTGRRVTLFNCFVMGVVEDSMDGIFDALKQGALTMQQGGGVGYDFSTLRPRGTPAHDAGTIASGPVSFMHIWDSMCATLLSTGARRGAMMATLRVDHPDIEDFVDAKRDPRALRHFNLSVLVSDEFMQAVRADAEWPLVFPVGSHEPGAPDTADDIVMRPWPGAVSGAGPHWQPVPCRVVRTVRARALWERILRSTYEYAEPGVLFGDRINRLNNLYYREHISATNPCGEIPLPPYGACDLGSVNLTRFVSVPFEDDAGFDADGLRETVRVAVRLMDNVIDVSRFPLAAQEAQAHGSRRIGLGLTGLADTLMMLGLHYGSPEARDFAAETMRTVCHEAYRTSVDLAREKGAFAFFEREAYLAAPFVQALPDDIRQGIAAHGIRNSHLTAIAPTGTISLLADNVSSGLEPVYNLSYSRRVLELDGSYSEYALTDYAYRLWRDRFGDRALPDYFVDVDSLTPEAHLDMQAALQPYVDNAISKTINVPAEYPFDDFRDLYDQAYDKGLKGCTTFRPNPVTGAILEAVVAPGDHASHCCNIERETD